MKNKIILEAVLTAAALCAVCFAGVSCMKKGTETSDDGLFRNGTAVYQKEVRVKNKDEVSCYVRVYMDFSDQETTGRSEISNDAYDKDDAEGSKSAFYSAKRDIELGADTEDLSDDSYIRVLSQNTNTTAPKWRFIPDDDDAHPLLAGYFYYMEPVEAGDSTDTLLKQIKVTKLSENQKAFDLLLCSETVKSEGYDDWQSAWEDFLSELEKENAAAAN